MPPPAALFVWIGGSLIFTLALVPFALLSVVILIVVDLLGRRLRGDVVRESSRSLLNLVSFGAFGKPVFAFAIFDEKHLTTREVLLAFTLYADTLLSISQVTPRLGRAYRSVYYASREVETAMDRGFDAV
jgi:hypothetical protein